MSAPQIFWTENNQTCQANWQSEANATAPKRVVLADDRLAADVAYRWVCEGVGLLWRGDYQNAKQLLQALARRIDKARQKKVRQPLRPPKLFINTVLHKFNAPEY